MTRLARLAAVVFVLSLSACKSEEVDPAVAAAQLQRDIDEAAARLRNDKVKDAEAIYLRILEKDPNQPDAIAGMARVRLAENDLGSAEVLLKQAAQAKPNDADIQYSLAEVYRFGDRHPEAAAAYGSAFALDPENANYGLAQGIALKKANSFAEAEKVLRKVIEIDPMAQFAYTELGDVLREQKRLDEALKTYMKAQSTYASDKMAHAGAALVYEAKGDVAHALDEWSTYIRMDCCSDYSNSVAKKKITELKVTDPVGGDAAAAGQPAPEPDAAG